MRYSSIEELEVCNGKGCGVSIFLQGCHFHCRNCFNQETWDFGGGHEFTADDLNRLISYADYDFISRLTILGGEPICDENVKGTNYIIKEFRNKFGSSKKIWLYTGYVYEDLNDYQKETVSMVDYLIDGRYEDDKRDLTLPFRGSSNQRIIRIQGERDI